MRVQEIVFGANGEAALQEDQQGETVEADHLLVATECQVVSAGTEIAILHGQESWAPLPYRLYGGLIGKVLKAGSRVTKFKPGDRVFGYASCRSVTVMDTLKVVVPVPPEIPSSIAALARMGQVAFTAPRVSACELGDTAAVIGLGLVGNIAAQLMQQAGCTVIGLDISSTRLATAKKTGIDYVVNSRESNPVAAIKEITRGAMCNTVIEATGIPNMAASAVEMAGNFGEVILLGTPRGEFTANATEMLRAVHLAERHVTLKGAHEWIAPAYPAPFLKHSLERNITILFDLLKRGKLHGKELISHCVPPSKCQEVYRRLLARDESYSGVVFDWTAMR